jgi:hypothetical protein
MNTITDVFAVDENGYIIFVDDEDGMFSVAEVLEEIGDDRRQVAAFKNGIHRIISQCVDALITIGA